MSSGEGMSPASYQAFKALDGRIDDVKGEMKRLDDSQKTQRAKLDHIEDVQGETAVTMGKVLLQLQIHTWIGGAVGTAIIVSAVAFVFAVVKSHLK